MNTICMSIDPGSNGTGYAIWNSVTKKFLKTGNIFSKSSYWQDKCNDIVADLEALWGTYKVSKMYIEYPQFFPTAGGEMVAGHGDLVKLAFIVGLICGNFLPREYELVQVLNWKGQLPKDVVIRRIKRILSDEVLHDVKTHTWDAIGIALFVQGEFK